MWLLIDFAECLGCLHVKLCLITISDPTLDSLQDDGVYIHGLFIEGAIWDRQNMRLGEAAPKNLYDTIPVVLLVPVEKKDLSKEGTYEVSSD